MTHDLQSVPYINPSVFTGENHYSTLENEDVRWRFGSLNESLKPLGTAIKKEVHVVLFLDPETGNKKWVGIKIYQPST